MPVSSCPSKQAIAAGLQALHDGPCRLRRLGIADLPATLSLAILTGTLRGTMGFEGAIITDDLGMAAGSETVPWEEVPVQALRAGVDLLLICHERERQEQAYARVLSAVQRGELAEALVDRAIIKSSCTKILASSLAP